MGSKAQTQRSADQNYNNHEKKFYLKFDCDISKTEEKKSKFEEG